MRRCRLRVVTVCIMALLSLQGCWQRLESYKLPRSSAPWCQTSMARIWLSHKEHTILRNCGLLLVPPYYSCVPCAGYILGFNIKNGQPSLLLTTIAVIEVRLPGEPKAIAGHVSPYDSVKTSLPLVFESPPLGLSRDWQVLFSIPKGIPQLQLRISGEFKTQTDTERFDCITPLDLSSTGFQYVGVGATME